MLTSQPVYVLWFQGQQVAEGSAERCWEVLRELNPSLTLHAAMTAGWSIDKLPAEQAA